MIVRLGLWKCKIWSLSFVGVMLPSVCLPAPAQMGQWAWMGGSDLFQRCNQSCILPVGVYGTLGVTAPGNVPGGRMSGATWTDNQGHFWLFGGDGYDSVGYDGNLNDLWEFDPASDQWTWRGGNSRLPFGQDEQAGWPGTYGTLGLEAPSNYPGARQQSMAWTDQSGNLWQFGGQGYGTVNGFTGNLFFNDLWVFHLSNAEWTWMSGSNTAGTTETAQPGVYGAKGIAAKGNTPGSRRDSVTWVDRSGNFWLFGGYGFDSAGQGAFLNDLWRFDPVSRLWTWMSGVNLIGPGVDGEPGIYGTLGVPAPANTPGGRQGAASWVDNGGNLWLFGGRGLSSVINSDASLNDLWEYSPSTGEWTWMGGSNNLSCAELCGTLGVYGTLNVPSTANFPGGRSHSNQWTDTAGNFWLFGGEGFTSRGQLLHLADLWKFSPNSNQWTWMGGWKVGRSCAGGSPACDWPGIYGTLSDPAIANSPGSRDRSVSWTDVQGNLWLLGGYAADITDIIAPLNDVWKYQMGTANPSVANPPTFNPVPGTYTALQNVTLSSSTENAAFYFTLDGTTPTTDSIVSSSATVNSSETIKAIAVVPNYLDSSVSSATYVINLPAPDFSFGATPASLTINSGGQGSLTLTVTPQNGFNSTVNFTCSGLPKGAACAFNPPTVQPFEGSVTTTALTITGGALASNAGPDLLLPATVALSSLFLLGFRRRSIGRTTCLITAAIFALGSIAACGGGGGTTQVTSSVAVTATSGSIQKIVSISLVIK